MVISEGWFESKVLMNGKYINKKYIPEEIKIFDSMEYYLVTLQWNFDKTDFEHIFVYTRKDDMIFGSRLPFKRAKFYYNKDDRKYNTRNPFYQECVSVIKSKRKY